ncbi:MAG: hypothetical protein QG608_2156 [Actinomycetota bacterium]|nr:hypothetical protein [Actinomycetota bacterium]
MNRPFKHHNKQLRRGGVRTVVNIDKRVIMVHVMLGLQVPSFAWPESPESLGPTLRRIAVEAEQSGMASFWVLDRLQQIRPFGEPEEAMLEGWTVLAHLAAVTEKITLGTMVSGVAHRHPGVLVKTATTLDVLSGGRAWLGMGAAWNEDEHSALGIDFPPLAERFERLEETLRIALRLWSGDGSPFEGRHYHLERPVPSPRPISRPRPRILIGGGGERKTLRLVAQYADACNIFEYGTDYVAGKLAVLRRHCAQVGREESAVEKTVVGFLSLSSDGRGESLTVGEAVQKYGEYADLGVDHAIVMIPEVWRPGSLALVPELVDQLRRIVPAGR